VKAEPAAVPAKAKLAVSVRVWPEIETEAEAEPFIRLAVSVRV
jgi:hypothetical protein